MSPPDASAPLEFGDSLTRALGFCSVRTSETSASAWLPRREGLEHPLSTLALSFIVDATPGVVCGAAARPSWVVTSDLFLRAIEPRFEGPLRAEATLSAASPALVCADVVVLDEGAGDRLIAVGSVGHVVREPPEDFDVPIGMGVGETYGKRPPAGPLPWSAPELSFARRDGCVELERTEVVTNPLGFVHGSALAALSVECAAAEGYELSLLHLRFARPVRGGPARARASSVADGLGRRIAQVEVRDAARADRVASFATLELRRR